MFTDEKIVALLIMAIFIISCSEPVGKPELTSLNEYKNDLVSFSYPGNWNIRKVETVPLSGKVVQVEGAHGVFVTIIASDKRMFTERITIMELLARFDSTAMLYDDDTITGYERVGGDNPDSVVVYPLDGYKARLYRDEIGIYSEKEKTHLYRDIWYLYIYGRTLIVVSLIPVRDYQSQLDGVLVAVNSMKLVYEE